MNNKNYAILLVEDDYPTAKMITDMLRDDREVNFTVSQVGDLSAATESVHKNTHDLILMDLNLPDSDGLNTVQRISGTPDTPPIIVLTSGTDGDFPVRAAELGIQDYLQKDEMNGALLKKSIVYSLERHKLQLRLQQKIKESEFLNRRLQTLIKAVPAVIYVRTPQAFPDFKYLSEDTHAVLGFSPEQLTKDSGLWMENCRPESQNELKALFEKLDGGESVEWEYAFDHPQKGTVWIQDCARMVRGKENEPLEIVGYMADITQRRQDEERIRHMAMYDPLTELPNRRLFFDRLHQTLAHSHRNKTLAALLYIDLDGFKRINDVYGHQAGDQTLLEVVRRIRSTLRKSDTVARLGGDEFAIILRDLGKKEHASSVADKIIETVKKPLEKIDRRASVGASIGIAFSGGVDEDLDGFLKKADSAMYEAKNSGGNRVRIYEKEEV